MTAAALVKRLVALVPPARQHLTTFHFSAGAEREAAADGYQPPSAGASGQAGSTSEEAEATTCGLGESPSAHVQE